MLSFLWLQDILDGTNGRRQLLLKIPTNSKYARQGMVPGTMGTGAQHFDYISYWKQLYAKCTHLTPEDIHARLFPANGGESAKICICVAHFLPSQFELVHRKVRLRRGELPQPLAVMFGLAAPPRPNRLSVAREQREVDAALEAVSGLDSAGAPTVSVLLAQQQQHAALQDVHTVHQDTLRLVGQYFGVVRVVIFRCLLMWGLQSGTCRKGGGNSGTARSIGRSIVTTGAAAPK